MTREQLAEVVSRLDAGAEFTVRNQDGWWGLRRGAEGITEWSRSPFDECVPDRLVTLEEVERMIGGWDYDEVVARLSPR